MENLLERVEVLEHHLRTLMAHTHTVERRLRLWRRLACGLVGLTVLAWGLPSGTAQHVQHEKTLKQRVAALEQLLKHFSRDGNDVFITGANLHIVNGLGRTDCGEKGNPIPDCPNGLGNLIVGYNELRDFENVRTGSHNVVVGKEHNFSRFGGSVLGLHSEISGDFASVSGGTFNTASGLGSSVSGGLGNSATGDFASVSGGQANEASGQNASVSGGFSNSATGDEASVSGGLNNSASGDNASVSGGNGNRASGFQSWVSGGGANEASGQNASVSGGLQNTASGNSSSISGGLNRRAEGELDWVAGPLFADE